MPFQNFQIIYIQQFILSQEEEEAERERQRKKRREEELRKPWWAKYVGGK